MNRQHIANPTTIEAISKLKPGLTWRKLAVNLGYPDNVGASLCNLAHGRAGQFTFDGEQELRRRLSLPPLLPSYTVPACPSCGSVHTGDCHGLQGEVVIVPAGARIVQPKAPSSKPARKRDRIEATRYTERGFSTAEIAEVNREVFDNGRIPSWLWNHPGMAEVLAGEIRRQRALAAQEMDNA